MPKKPRRQRKPPVSLSDEQFLALLQKAKEHRLRDWILILFTYRHGFRASEPLGVTEADIDLRDGKVFVRRGKGSEGGWQDLLSWPENPLMDERGALEFWLANRGRFGVKGGAKADGRQRGKQRRKDAQDDRARGSGVLAGDDGFGSRDADVRTAVGTVHDRARDAGNDADGSGRIRGVGLEETEAVKMQQSMKNVAFSPNGGCDGQKSDALVAAIDPHAGDAVHPDALAGLDAALAPSALTCGKPAGGSETPASSQGELLDPPAPPYTPSELLFPISRSQFWRLVHKYALAAGIPPRKCKTHMLKHTIAKQLVRAGHPVNEIMEWMGWRSMETMMWYIRPDEEELGQRIGNQIRGMQGLRAARQGSLFP